MNLSKFCHHESVYYKGAHVYCKFIVLIILHASLVDLCVLDEKYFLFPSAAWNLFLMRIFVFWLQLQMDTLQSRLDAEFLLAHMCSVKFKEWIVVLATLLRRAEVKLVEFYSTILHSLKVLIFLIYLDSGLPSPFNWRPNNRY
jgi:hypothetical protein